MHLSRLAQSKERPDDLEGGAMLGVSAGEVKLEVLDGCAWPSRAGP